MNFSCKISISTKNTYMKDMTAKLKHAICSMLVMLCALQGVANSSGGNSLLPESFELVDANSVGDLADGQKVLSAEGLAVKDDLKVEFGEGHGESIDEALKEAMKDALQKVVGIYVDSDFRMNNDVIIQDEIITHSNGFIDHYKKIDEENDKDGRGKVVTIKAWVKMRDFVNRMKKIAPSQRVKVDGLLLDNDLGNKLNAEVLLRKEFEDFDPIMDLMEVSLVDSLRPEIVSSQDDVVVLRYAYVIKYSKDKYYKKFLPRINTLFDQIAQEHLGLRSIQYKVDKVDVWPIAKAFCGEDECWKSCKASACFLHEIEHKSAWHDRVERRIVAVGESISKSGVVTTKEWVLPEHLYATYQKYRSKYLDSRRKVCCIFCLLDDAGNILSQSMNTFAGRALLPCDFPIGFQVREPDFMPLMGLWHSGYFYNVRDVEKGRSIVYTISRDGHLDRYVGYVDITIDKKDISKIKSAEIKLETNKKESEQ